MMLLPLALILVILAGSVGLLLLRDALHGVVVLAGILIAIALLFLLLGAPFLAAMEVMLYLGAILVLFLFTLMLLGPTQRASLAVHPWRQGAIWGAVLLLALLLVVGSLLLGHTAPAPAIQPLSPRVLGLNLFGPWRWLVEGVAILLFAVIGSVLVLHADGEDEPHD